MTGVSIDNGRSIAPVAGSGKICVNGTLIDLPDKHAPTLALLHPTEEEKLAIWKQNGVTWRGALSMEAYLRREQYLSDQEVTRDGGITYWILVDTAAKNRLVLSACETYRKRALVACHGEIEEAISHGIGSVFCPPQCRRRGFAGVMMKMLGEKLKTWQSKENTGCAFSILYSDIGKEFYAARGWEVFASSHISITAASKLDEDVGHIILPEARPLYACDLQELCVIDESLVRRTLLHASTTDDAYIAIIPDVSAIRWHHAREEFVATELHGRSPIIKGAIVGVEPGTRVWCYWTRMFYNENPKRCENNTLHILRLVVEEQSVFSGEGQDASVNMSKYIPAITALFKMAQKEALEWNMMDVEVWNPDDSTLQAVRAIEPSAQLVDRDVESIACLMWYGARKKEGPTANYVHWMANEKYGWC